MSYSNDSQLTIVKVCIQAASTLVKVSKVVRKLRCTTKIAQLRENVKIAQKLRCARLQFSGGKAHTQQK